MKVPAGTKVFDFADIDDNRRGEFLLEPVKYVNIRESPIQSWVWGTVYDVDVVTLRTQAAAPAVE